MAEYKSILHSGRYGGAQPNQQYQDYDLISAIKARYERPGSAVMKILATLSIPSQVVASMVREKVERDRGAITELPYGEAALRGLANPETSYRDIEGMGAKTGTAADIIVDPLWFVPGKFFASAGSGVARIAGRTAGGALRKFPAADRAVARQLTKVIKHYDKTRAGYKGFEAAVEEPARMAESEMLYNIMEKINKNNDEIVKLVPDAKRRVAVFEAAELVQPKSVEGKIGDQFYDLTKNERKAYLIGKRTTNMVNAFRERIAKTNSPSMKAILTHKMQDRMVRSANEINRLVPDSARQKTIFNAMEELHMRGAGTGRAPVPPARQITGPVGIDYFAGLSQKERRAAEIALDSAKEIQDFRKAYGVLSDETALGFEELHGLTYFSRAHGQTREGILADLDQSIADFNKAGKTDGVDYLKKVRDHFAAMDDTPSESYIKELVRGAKGSKPSFLREREIVKSMRQLGASEEAIDRVMYALTEKDVAKNLHMSSVSTARAVYRKVYLDRFINYMRKHNLLHTSDDLLKLPPSAWGKGDNTLVKIEGIKELEGMYAPRVLVQDIKDQVLSPLDPERVKNAYSLARRLNYYWRGWALSVPMTTVRNAVDSMAWRNAAGGMGPKDAQHIVRAAHLVKAAKEGRLTKADKLIWQDMVRAGVARSNMYEETRQMARNLDPKNWLQRTLDPNPSRNPWTRFFFDKGGNVEDVARGGMFLWRRSKGDTVQEAMRHVNKWHIDYRYGLTQWERNVRDRVIPFYTFTRFNMPLALETMVMKPKLVAAAGHAMETWEDMNGGPEPDFPLAGWMESGTPMRWKYDSKSKNYFIQMLDGWWSFTDINKFVPGRMLDEAINMLSPIYTTPGEIIKNYNTFTKRPIERPGDKFELLGARAEFPLDKRLEHLIRTFRPLDEADKTLRAFSSKYGQGIWDRGINAMSRMLFGRQYPTNREEQIRVIAATTNEEIKALRAARRRAEEAGDEETIRELNAREDALKAKRKEFGIK